VLDEYHYSFLCQQLPGNKEDIVNLGTLPRGVMTTQAESTRPSRYLMYIICLVLVLIPVKVGERYPRVYVL
jgi:hypothetical protein